MSQAHGSSVCPPSPPSFSPAAPFTCADTALSLPRAWEGHALRSGAPVCLPAASVELQPAPVGAVCSSHRPARVLCSREPWCAVATFILGPLSGPLEVGGAPSLFSRRPGTLPLHPAGECGWGACKSQSHAVLHRSTPRSSHRVNDFSSSLMVTFSSIPPGTLSG